MYGSNEFDIQFVSQTKPFDQIHFKLMMNKIIDPDLNKIINTFCGLKTIFKCIVDRVDGNALIKVEYKFDGQTIFYECVDFKSSGL